VSLPSFWAGAARQRLSPILAGFASRFRVASVVVLVIVANLFAVRYEQRWDVTTDGRYTPSPKVTHLLRTLPRPTTAIVFLGRGDPLAPSVEQLLSSYANVTSRFHVEWVDPDRDPARFLAKQTELGIRTGQTEDGLVTTDALVVLRSSDSKQYYLTPEDVTGLDPEHSDGGATFERAIATALTSLARTNKPVFCFTTGHRELSPTDLSPIGLARFQQRLERNAMLTKVVDPLGETEAALSECNVIAIAAPDVPLTPAAIERLVEAAKRTSSLLLLGGVVPSDSGRLVSVGLEPLAKLGGIQLQSNLTIEFDDRFRLPNLYGETFFATPVEHAVTRGLLRGPADAPLRVVVALAQSQSKIPGSNAQALLVSSAKSKTVSDVSRLAEGSPKPDTDLLKSEVVAMAGIIDRPAQSPNRVVVLPTNIVQNRSYDSPALVVTQAFADSVVAWLTASPNETIEVAARSERPMGLELSERETIELTRYVLLVMPGAVLLFGMAVYARRRRDGRRTQRSTQGAQNN
jgi:hypothetical protein